MGKAHSNKGRYFRFNNDEEIERFILLYVDLFTPYSEDVIKYEKKYYSISDLERGFARSVYNWNNVLRVNLTRENLDKILKSRCFRKERLGRNRSIYVFV